MERGGGGEWGWGRGGTCWHQEGGTSERTAWPATSDEDAKAPSGWEHKLEFWILNFLICLFISVPFIFWHGASCCWNGEYLGRHVRERISKSSCFWFSFSSFVCLFWSPPTFPPLSLIFISYVSGRWRSCEPLWAAPPPPPHPLFSLSFCLIHGRSGSLSDGADGQCLRDWRVCASSDASNPAMINGVLTLSGRRLLRLLHCLPSRGKVIAS